MIKVVMLFMAILLAGCASTEYQYGVDGQNVADAGRAPRMKEQFLAGNPHWFLDQSGWIWPGSLFSKLILWNKDVDSHAISEGTKQAAREYIEANDIDNVQVLFNNYRPGNQWGRLFRNRTVGAGWRYTLGIMSVVGYTIMPGRFFGGDAFNPYTNTIYLYSDDPAIALHEAGHAKDSNSRKYKGTHAFLYMLPLAPLYYEAVASNDAISYLQDKGRPGEQKEAYKTLHPAYGTYVSGGLLGAPFNDYWWASIPGAVIGHITGNISAAMVDDPVVEPVRDDAIENMPVDIETESVDIENEPAGKSQLQAE